MGLHSSSKVFLTNPPLNMAETPLQYHRPLVPLGLAYIGAVLEHAFTGGAYDSYVTSRLRGAAPGYHSSGRVAVQDNMLLSFYGRFSMQLLISQMTKFFEHTPPGDQFIGLSVLSDGMRAAKRMLRLFRARFPAATIMVGGPHATFFPYDFYETPAEREGPLVDFVVRNEGETVIPSIINRLLETSSDLRYNGPRIGLNIDRCDYSDPNYRIIEGGQFGSDSATVGLHILDRLPFPAYFLFEDADRKLPYEPDRRYGLVAPAANINSSRGCPHKCTFCTIPKLAPGYRTLSPRRMVDTVDFLSKEYGLQSIFFREDNFMYSGGTIEGGRWSDVADFCRELIDRKLNMRWAIEARADNVLEPSGVPGQTRIDLLSRAGLSGIYIGVESGSDAMLKVYGKGSSTSHMAAAIKAAHDRNVAIVATSLYGDPDLLFRTRFVTLNRNNPEYDRATIEQREQILRETRCFMDKLNIPHELREEYALVGIPISTVYQLLDQNRQAFPRLVEHYDPDSRYIYPKGFRWWSTKVYESAKRVRPYFGYDFAVADDADIVYDRDLYRPLPDEHVTFK